MASIKEELDSIVYAIFTRTYTCRFDLATLGILRSIEDSRINFPEDSVFVTVGQMGFDKGIVRTERNNYRDLYDSMVSRTRSTLSLDYINHLGEDTKEYRTLTIEKMAELLAHSGAFEFTSLSDCKSVSKTITDYIDLIVEYSNIEVHYRKPPEKDMNALIALNDKIKYYLDRVAQVDPKEPILIFGLMGANSIKQEAPKLSTSVKVPIDANPYEFNF